MTEQNKKDDAGGKQIASKLRPAWERPELRKMDAGEAEAGFRFDVDHTAAS